MPESLTRRQWIALCGLSVAVGLAGCIGDDDSGDDTPTPTQPTPTPWDDNDDWNDEEQRPDRLDPDSFAYDVEFVDWSDADGVVTSTITGYVTADGDHYEAMWRVGEPTEREWGYGDTLYFIDIHGDCHTTNNYLDYGFYFSPLWAIYRPRLGQIWDEEYVRIDTIDGIEVEVYPNPYESQIEVFESYLSVETRYWVGADVERYDDDGTLVSETHIRLHSFDEEMTVTLPEECN